MKRARVHPWGGLVVIGILSLVILLLVLVWLGGAFEGSVEQVPSDIKTIKTINDELRNQGLEPIEF